MNEAMEVDAGAGDDVVMDEDLEGSLSDDLSDDLEPTQEPTQRRPSMSEDEERKRRASIKAILADGNISETERRRSIQHLMDGRRNSRSGASTPTAIESDATPTNGNSNQETQQPVPSEDLLQESFSQLNYVVTPVANEQTKRFELTRPECTHYDRQCTLIAPCCGAAFGCRICHDDCPVLPPKITVQQARRRYPRSSSLPSSFTNMNQTPEDTHHTIDRFAVREVICRKCYCRQSSKR